MTQGVRAWESVGNEVESFVPNGGWGMGDIPVPGGGFFRIGLRKDTQKDGFSGQFATGSEKTHRKMVLVVLVK